MWTLHTLDRHRGSPISCAHEPRAHGGPIGQSPHPTRRQFFLLKLPIRIPITRLLRVAAALLLRVVAALLLRVVAALLLRDDNRLREAAQLRAGALQVHATKDCALWVSGVQADLKLTWSPSAKM